MSHVNPGKQSKTVQSRKDLWQTTDAAYRDALFLCGVNSSRFDLDAAASKGNFRGWRYLGLDHCEPAKRDALSADWGGGEGGSVWCNPPFSRKTEFLEKAHSERSNTSVICLMIPYQPCTTWWRRLVHERATTVFVPDGRYNFIDPVTGKEVQGVNFASCFVVFTSAYNGGRANYIEFNRGVGVLK